MHFWFLLPLRDCDLSRCWHQYWQFQGQHVCCHRRCPLLLFTELTYAMLMNYCDRKRLEHIFYVLFSNKIMGRNVININAYFIELNAKCKFNRLKRICNWYNLSRLFTRKMIRRLNFNESSLLRSVLLNLSQIYRICILCKSILTTH